MHPRLITAVTAAAAALALVPAGASAAHRHPLKPLKPGRTSPVGRCHVSLVAEPHLIRSGDSSELFGRYTCPRGAGLEGQPVVVYEHSAGNPGVQTLSTTTILGGFYKLTAPTLTTDTVLYATVLGARSPSRLVKVAPPVTFEGPEEKTTLETGKNHAVIFHGTVPADDAGARVILQRENSTSNEEWHAIQFGTVAEGGNYSLTHVFVIPGTASLRVVVRPHKFYSVRGISETRSYVISQRENPLLTLTSTSDPIPYGSSVTLEGALSGGAGQTMTLMAHTAGGGPFVAIAKTTATTGGKYTFTQMPTANTAYRVIGGGRSSAVLFEGVKYALTATVSASSVVAGQQLEFTGSILPGREHPIYLERQNAFGGGFHVVDAVAADKAGKYTIPFTVFGGAGKTQVFRVKVPGDPFNQGISSTPFTVEVTPAPASALHPVMPAKQPSEGQV